MTSSPDAPIERAVQLYGDLLFDLCESVLWSPSNAQIAFRSILKDLKRRSRKQEAFVQLNRAWVLRIACNRLRQLSSRHRPRMTPAEQIELDSTSDLGFRLKHFDHYFHRLPTEDQLLLLLKDKYGLPYPEIAIATGTPEGSLKIRRQQALGTLEEWLWDSR